MSDQSDLACLTDFTSQTYLACLTYETYLACLTQLT